MKAVAGVFKSGDEARRLAQKVCALGVPEDHVAVLVPKENNNHWRHRLRVLEAEGLPEDESFICEDALRGGRSVLIALAEAEGTAGKIRNLMAQEGVESIASARERWWVGLREGEKEHYAASGRDFRRDERFYRLGFEAAVHSRTRGKEYDQVLSELARDLDELEKRYPAPEIEEPFRRGYERGTAYFESIRRQE
jgi:hypothetical protein